MSDRDRFRIGLARLGVFFVPLLGAALAASAVRSRGCAPAPIQRETLFRGAPYVEKGDLEAIRARGYLRILSERSELEYLPRDADPLFQARELARDFGVSLGVEAVLVPVDAFEELVPALLEGHGDLISENLTVTEARKAQVAFTLPIGWSREQIVAPVGDSLAGFADLHGRTLGVQPGTSFYERALELRERVPGMRVAELPPEMTRAEILDAVAAREIDLTVEDSNVLEVELDYRPELHAALDLGGERAVAWAVRPGNRELLGALNSFLQQQRITRERNVRHLDDLPGLKKRRRLRMLTRNTTASYFLWRGELRGFEYELVREFARRQGMRVDVVVAESHDQLLPMLLEGRGDLAAAFLTPTDARRDMGVAFSSPYNWSVQQVVARAAEPAPAGPADLDGRTIVVRRSSSYWESVAALRQQGVGVELVAAPEDLDVEGIVARVAAGDYDLTVVDSHLLDLELTHRDDVRAAFDLGEPQPHAWAIRAEDTQLLAAVNAFWAEEYRGPFYNVVFRRYFEAPERIRAVRQEREENGRAGRFTDWDEAVRRYAREYGFDWRLIMALMYQESRFDPEAVSWAGARGLLQVMPETAKQFGVHDLGDPEVGILAGIRYLAWLRDRYFAPEQYAEDRIWFAIAAYNTGLGHVLDARRVARQLGWNADRWFGHVEQAMPLLSRPEYASHARHGYLSGRRPVAYVRLIRDRYGAYINLTAEWESEPVAPPVG